MWQGPRPIIAEISPTHRMYVHLAIRLVLPPMHAIRALHQGRTIGTPLLSQTPTRCDFQKKILSLGPAITDLLCHRHGAKKSRTGINPGKMKHSHAAYEKIASTGRSNSSRTLKNLILPRSRELMKSEAGLKESLSEKEVLLSWSIHHRVEDT